MFFFENIKHLDPVWLVTFGALVILALALSLFSIWDAFNREFKSSNEKFAWLQLAILVPFLGGLAYIIFGRKRGKKLS